MTYRNAISAAALLTVFLIVLPQPAAAQEARSFEQLQLLVKPGDRIFVTDSNGKVTEGKVEGLSRSLLSLKTKVSTTNWAETDVTQIRQWRHDSLKNGALIGAGVGFGLSLFSAIVWCHEWGDCGGETVGAVAFYTGIGAGIGVGVDALIPAKQTIYAGAARTALRNLRVKPVVGNSRKGVALTFSF
jgi:hypothetical protein